MQLRNAESHNFHATMLRDASIWASIPNTIAQAAIKAGFSATLPVYLRDTFNWDPSSAGETFFALQAPIIFLSPLLGWVRDRVGVRLPTIVGWALLCPLLCLLGVPGGGFSWFKDSQNPEQVAFIVCICGIGLFLSFVQGGGALHKRSKSKDICLILIRERMLTTNFCSDRYGWKARRRESPHLWSQRWPRCFAMISVSFNTGLTLGPAVSRELFRTIGYFYMNIILGR